MLKREGHVSIERLKADILLLLNIYTDTLLGMEVLEKKGTRTIIHKERAVAIMKYIGDASNLEEILQIIQNEISLMDRGQPLVDVHSTSEYFIGKGEHHKITWARHVPDRAYHTLSNSEYRRILEELKILVYNESFWISRVPTKSINADQLLNADRKDSDHSWFKRNFNDLNYRQVLCLSDTYKIRQHVHSSNSSIARELEVMLSGQCHAGGYNEILIRQASHENINDVPTKYMDCHLPPHPETPRREYVTLDNRGESFYKQHYNMYDLVLGRGLLCFCYDKTCSCGGLSETIDALYVFLIKAASCLRITNPYSLVILSGNSIPRYMPDYSSTLRSFHRNGKVAIQEAVRRFKQNNSILHCQYTEIPRSSKYYSQPNLVMSEEYHVTIFNKNFIRPFI